MLQATVSPPPKALRSSLRGSKGRHAGLAFQEYDARNPHKKWTMGFAGRPGGPAFYISTVDNTRNHGPGSQGSKTEADGCFGRVRMEEAATKTAAERLFHVWGHKATGFAKDRMGFLSGPGHHSKEAVIKALRVRRSGGGGA